MMYFKNLMYFIVNEMMPMAYIQLHMENTVMSLYEAS